MTGVDGRSRSTRALVVTRAARESYTPDVLELSERRLPSVADGDIHVRVLYLSLDPTNRNWLKLDPVNTLYEKIGRNLSVGDSMVGELIGRVEESRATGFERGDLVAGIGEWQDEAVVPADRMRRVKLREGEPLASHLTIFSHVGLAAMVGMHEVARIAQGETVLVSAAAGATGRLAVGIAKAHGCRVIGIAGGPEKLAIATDAGADATIDYRSSSNLAGAIHAAAPEGVDAYFDNVGGQTLDAALLAMNPGGRIAVCGVMSDYDVGEARHGVRNMFQVLVRHLRVEGFLAGHFLDRREEYYAELRRLRDQGWIEHQAEESVGLESAPQQLARLFTGANRAKLLVRLP
ncbi:MULTISPECIES: zinc-binding dehydrogenase [unclassified Modestobacter]